MINFNTLSMCEHCYRHVPATKFEKDGHVWLGKTCLEHGYHETLVEIDANFYFNEQVYYKRTPGSYWLDITNRCNLDCPHCYQMPDNLSKDPSIELILNQIKKLPDDGLAVSLVGAEPTTRKDLPNIIEAINDLPFKKRDIMIVTNGINLGKLHYAEKFINFDNLKWTIGLNHPDYNGGIIRKKQQAGIDNCITLGLKIKNFTYTIANYDQLPYVLDEVQYWNVNGVCDNARIQVGVDIGKTPEHEEEHYLSDLVHHAKKISKDKNWSWNPRYDIANRTHYAVEINNVLHRLIKWCDVKTIDFEETQSESWAKLIPHKPMSSLLHQVILRDRFVNMKKQLLDTIPKKYAHNEL